MKSQQKKSIKPEKKAEGSFPLVRPAQELWNPRQIHSFAKSAGDGHAYILNHNVLRIMGLSDDPSDRVFNALLYSAGVIVIAIIMVGSIFLIYNSFSISLNERMRQI